MFSIILISHGQMSQGILHSSEMIFGKQEDVVAVSLNPDEGPDDFRKKLEEAIASLGNTEKILFLADLWGGTPFNQASNLINEKEKGGDWLITAGMNLPMVIESYSARFSGQDPKDVIKGIVGEAKKGVKVFPEEFNPQEEKPAAPAKKAGSANLPTSGQIQYVLARIDTRLLHGQVATGWTKAANPDRIIVVSDNVAKDKLRKNMIAQAAPSGVPANTVPIKKMAEVAKDVRFGETKAMLLFETPEDALKAIESGVDIKELNVGSMAYSNGKVNVNQVLAMDQEDVDTLKKLRDMGVKFDVRKVPNSSPENMDELLKKAQSLIDGNK